ncbi:HNH endonuclease signature motif containing protein [uncultured Microbacterium sp.]|uniref:HNH nuclease n=1 Tax=uncultured Microbacterium sp. TaxID=191216 RepID=A0A1Y5P1V1_9MICO|nr:HNH endonuclease signature motif containing protein [uncultured Microbacterium sp.]SBS70071.1 HNH nuclease [uncultured Microbacterium sp.]
MSTTLDDLTAAVAAVCGLWPGEHVEGTEAGRLVALNDALGKVRRLADAATVRVAAEIARQSRPELGADSLARKQGFRNANVLLASELGIANGEAARLVEVGEATAPRVLLTGEHAPARHPHVGEAVEAGVIGMPAASAIIRMLDRVVTTAGRTATDAAEQTLIGQAPGLTLDALSKVLARAEAYLDPDGVALREDELRAKESLRMREDSDGMLHLTAVFGPERGAPIKAALEGYVTARLAAQRDAAAARSGMGESGQSEDAPADALFVDDVVDAPRPTIPQLHAEALALICEHLLGCADRDVPVQGATVVVRLSLDDLESGTGYALIDGMTTPVSVGTARRMAADTGIIPCVLGGDSEILDWGRQKRLFTPAQRLALGERDGGCAGCGAPPSHCKVHHLDWWKRDRGPTDLSNGILLCTSCHHRIHDSGWTIRIDGAGIAARVWFIPPPWIDAAQTPRLGARRRFDYVAA